MSLDVYLVRDRWISYDEGKTHEKDQEVVYDANITHNLGEMARRADIYYALWRPEEIGVIRAGQLIELLEKGLATLKTKTDYFNSFNSQNGWGVYSDFVPFVEKYLNACKQYPDARVEVSR